MTESQSTPGGGDRLLTAEEAERAAVWTVANVAEVVGRREVDRINELLNSHSLRTLAAVAARPQLPIPTPTEQIQVVEGSPPGHLFSADPPPTEPLHIWWYTQNAIRVI